MRWIAALAPAIGVLMVATTTAAGPEKVAYPEGYQGEFVEYLRVNRPDRNIVRFMYVNPAAHEAAQPGEPLPDGTVLVMEDHKARLGAGEEPETDAEGRLVPTDEVTNVFVMEKQPGWGPSIRTTSATANGSTRGSCRTAAARRMRSSTVASNAT